MATSIHHGVVVGVDGSPASMYAVDWAAREAAMRDSTLSLVHVAGSHAAHGEAVLRDARVIAEEAAGKSDAGKSDAGKSDAVRIATATLPGEAVPVLVGLSAGAELMVVGRRGLGAVGRYVLGSVSRGLIHDARCPVAVIHDEDPLMASPVTAAPVVVGVDGSRAAEAALGLAFDEASRRRVELVAVYAYSHDFAVVDGATTWTSPEDELAGWLARWRGDHPDVAVRRIVARDQPDHQLTEQSESAQLVVVGRRDAESIASGASSVSDAVIESARMPVIVVPTP
jgi:nucleotide-binding universal stress UspA family protein